MLLIRRFEERAEEQYTRARIGGYCHLAIGEEAANVGSIDPMVEKDYVFTSYRDHGTALAVGSDPAAVMAELFGRATGVSGGYGGSMHLMDVQGAEVPVLRGMGSLLSGVQVLKSEVSKIDYYEGHSGRHETLAILKEYGLEPAFVDSASEYEDDMVFRRTSHSCAS
jgi:hypothetical protein